MWWCTCTMAWQLWDQTCLNTSGGNAVLLLCSWLVVFSLNVAVVLFLNIKGVPKPETHLLSVWAEILIGTNTTDSIAFSFGIWGLQHFLSIFPASFYCNKLRKDAKEALMFTALLVFLLLHSQREHKPVNINEPPTFSICSVCCFLMQDSVHLLAIYKSLNFYLTACAKTTSFR